MNRLVAAYALSLLLLVVGSVAQASDSQISTLLSPAQLRQDLRFIQDALVKTHPDINISADAVALKATFNRIERDLVKPMTADQAWRHFSLLNPVFADAHVSVISPDPTSQTQALLSAGNGLFPFEVSIDPLGRVYILSALGGGASPNARARIEKINGIPTHEVTRALLARTNGDTAALRAVILSARWWWFYWKVFGTPKRYVIELKSASGTSIARMPASTQTPSWIKEQDASDFDNAFRFWQLNEETAVLTINTFDWADKKRFYAFTKRAFTNLKDSKTTNLVIDIRKNGGGDDDMWKEGILPYIATKRYRHGSTFLLRVIEGRQRDSQKVGDLVEGQIQGWVEPRQDEALIFGGNIYVLIGGATYSSAVLFANVVQDFSFGKLVGTGGYARTRQSGGVQTYTLPNSQLRIVVPRFVLDRPSGVRDPTLLTPDVPLDNDPFEPEKLWTNLRTFLHIKAVAK